MNKNGFSRCGELYIGLLRKEGRFSTAHVYQNALFSFNKFCGNTSVSFRQVTRDRLRRYGEHLYDSGLKPNTVSTYMRMLRSIYNRGVESGSAPYIHGLFRDVYTGVDIRQKKALPMSELRRLLYEDPKSESLRRTQSIAALMFQFCGMSFADLAHLEKSALDCNVLRYNRIKTRTPMSVEVLDTAKEVMNQLRNSQPSRPGCPDYLSVFSPAIRNVRMNVLIVSINLHYVGLIIIEEFGKSFAVGFTGNFLHDPPFLGNYCKISWSSN